MCAKVSNVHCATYKCVRTLEAIGVRLRPMSMTRSALVVGASAALLVVAAACALFALPWFQAVPAASGAVVVLALCFAATSFAVHRLFSRRPLHVASVMNLAFVPVMAMAAFQAFAGRFAVKATAAADWVGVAAAALCCFTLTAVLALALRRVPPERAARGMHVVAMLAMFGCGALLAHPQHGLLRSHQSSSLVAHQAGLSDGARSFAEQAPQPTDGGYALGRSCISRSCFALISHDKLVRVVGPLFAREASLELRPAAAPGEMLLVADSQVIAVVGGELHAANWDPVSAANVARLGAPTSFRLLAVLALVGGTLLLLWRRRMTRELLDTVRAESAFVHDNGWWHIDGRATFMRPLTQLVPGPALAYAGGSDAVAYRGAVSDGAAKVVSGSRESILRRVRAKRDTLDSVTCAWLCQLAAPLCVAFALAL
jgi:hypothetical protein